MDREELLIVNNKVWIDGKPCGAGNFLSYIRPYTKNPTTVTLYRDNLESQVFPARGVQVEIDNQSPTDFPLDTIPTENFLEIITWNSQCKAIDLAGLN